MFLGLADCVLAKMKDTGSKHGIGTTLLDTLGQVTQLADPARCDYRHLYGTADRPSQCQIEAIAGTVAIHAGQQDLASAALGHL